MKDDIAWSIILAMLAMLLGLAFFALLLSPLEAEPTNTPEDVQPVYAPLQPTNAVPDILPEPTVERDVPHESVMEEPEIPQKSVIEEVEVIPVEEVDPLEKAISIGECKITHYCCEKRKHICGTGDGITATGIEVKPGIVAVDPKVIPLHSDVYINGVWYKAEDIGGAIKGNRVDIAVPTHTEALQLGIVYHEVLYIPPEA